MGMVQDLYSTVLMLNTFNMGMVSIHYVLLVSMGMVQDLYTIHFIYHGNGTRFVHCTTLNQCN